MDKFSNGVSVATLVINGKYGKMCIPSFAFKSNTEFRTTTFLLPKISIPLNSLFVEVHSFTSTISRECCNENPFRVLPLAIQPSNTNRPRARSTVGCDFTVECTKVKSLKFVPGGNTPLKDGLVRCGISIKPIGQFTGIEYAVMFRYTILKHHGSEWSAAGWKDVVSLSHGESRRNR